MTERQLALTGRRARYVSRMTAGKEGGEEIPGGPSSRKAARKMVAQEPRVIVSAGHGIRESGQQNYELDKSWIEVDL